MPTVAELSDLYGNFMIAPRRGPNVCCVCFNLTDGYGRCYACTHGGRWLDAMAPISYSVAGEQLHHALVAYKRSAGPVARRLGIELSAVLWRYLADHEICLARAAGVESFELVTFVPSGDQRREDTHPLRRLVGELVAPTRGRYRPLLSRSDKRLGAHEFSTDKFEPHRDLDGRTVLLVDDTWTTGANAQSACAALKRAGARAVAAVVIGRHVNRGWRDNDRRLRSLRPPFDWQHCVYCHKATAAD